MANNFSSADLNPIRFASDWHAVTIGNVRSPGVIPKDGVKGFERETGWDKKAGKGTAGATLTRTGKPPAEGSFDFLLWLPEHFTQWEAFRKLLNFDTVTGKSTGAYDIYYPALVDLKIKSCVTAKISPIVHKGKGLYTCTVKMIEFNPPAKTKNVTATPKSAAPTATVPGLPPDPVGDEQQRRIKGLLEQGRAAGVLP